MTLRPTITALTLLVALGPGTAALLQAKPRKDCIKQGEISTLRALDDKHVYIKASASRHFLVTMDTRCQGLGDARKVEVFEPTSRLCGQGTSLISFVDPAAGPMRCRIATIEPVKSLADAEEKASAEVRPSPEP